MRFTGSKRSSIGSRWRGVRQAAKASAAKTYTVKAGDTLSGIAKEHLGNAGDYKKIFELNKDQLTDPDKIKPGQVLKIPAAR